MIFQWKLPTGELAAGIHRTIERVLIELDGPQLVILKDQSGRRFIGHAADSEPGFERWLHAETTNLEIEALCSGAVPMRNVLSKKGLELIDYTDDQPRALWRISVDQVPSGVLPVRGANLPERSGGAALASLGLSKGMKLACPVFRCDGAAIVDDAIGFGAISALATSIQRLWSELATALLSGLLPVSLSNAANAAMLRMRVPVHGSFGISVAPNEDATFKKIARAYRDITRVSPDVAKDVEGLSPGVLLAYNAYLNTLDTLDTEVLAQLGDGSAAYIGPAYAHFARGAIRSIKRAAEASVGEMVMAPRIAHGFFRGADLDQKTFKFFDNVSASTIKGRIATDVAKTLDAEDVIVGSRTLYNVQIERRGKTNVMVRAEKRQLRLLP